MLLSVITTVSCLIFALYSCSKDELSTNDGNNVENPVKTNDGKNDNDDATSHLLFYNDQNVLGKGSVKIIEIDNLSKEQKSMVETLVSFENLDKNKVYKINSKQLKEELVKHPKSIVRLAGLGCNSDSCKPLSLIMIIMARNSDSNANAFSTTNFQDCR